MSKLLIFIPTCLTNYKKIGDNIHYFDEIVKFYVGFFEGSLEYMYKNYVNNFYHNALSAYNAAKKNTAFNTISREAKSDIRMSDKKIELIQLLEAPMTHIVLYRPIFRDLMARTLKDLAHPDHKHLELVMAQIDVVSQMISQKKRFAELDQKMKKNDIIGPLVDSDRKLIREGFLVMGRKQKRMYVILCSDIMLTTSVNQKGIFNTVGLFTLDKIKLNRSATTEVRSSIPTYSFEIFDENKNKTTVFICNGEAELNDWYNTISSLIEKKNTNN